MYLTAQAQAWISQQQLRIVFQEIGVSASKVVSWTVSQPPRLAVLHCEHIVWLYIHEFPPPRKF